MGAWVVRGIAELDRPVSKSVVCIGNFDGVHLGHRALVERARERATVLGAQTLAFTFKPHPQIALKPGTPLSLLSTYDEKLELLQSLGVDLIIEEPFGRQFSTTEPEQFFSETLIGRLNAAAIVVGYDFAFGRERQGHLEQLQAFCAASGVELDVVPPQRLEGEVISSSQIRKHLSVGEVARANGLLGRPFSYAGVVVRGEGRGRLLGFPTANLKLENKLTLPYGVYATRAVRDDRSFVSVTNVGVRPTFAAPAGAALQGTELPALVEAHLLDVTLDLYGSVLKVEFFEMLRPERKFAGVDALKAQIALDAKAARAKLAAT